MSRYRTELPQLQGSVFLTDSGLETDLIFNHGLELPEFASFVLLDDEAGSTALRRYFDAHVKVAREHGAGIVLETATWRANHDWATQLGYDDAALADINRRAVQLLVEVREANPDVAVVISGVLGPRDDGYQPASRMSATEAQEYHAVQVQTFADTDVDLVHAMTMTYANEAIGVDCAAGAADVPVAISFTVETDGHLPDGSTLEDAVSTVDDATNAGVTYYGVNCAHPTHFAHLLDRNQQWTQRLRSLRANASRMSHAELDNAEHLDAGDPIELAAEYAAIRDKLPNLTILGGCCGSDVRHVEAIARTCLSSAQT